ncbi:MAG: hypothetical protein H5U17_06990 [Defluviimonas sp.]|nr:hypothetical protein [Defluviimonas sp.]
MFRVLFPALLLAGCIAPPETPPPPPNGATVSHLGETYQIEATRYGWRVDVDGYPVSCRKPTVKDCYWSLRNYRAAQAKIESIDGNPG